MSNNSSTVTLAAADLERVFGGAGLGAFPASDVGTAAGQGITETYKQRGNIAGALNDAHRWGHEKGWAAINSVGSGVSNFFNPPAAGPSTYTPATSNGNGPVTPGTLTSP